MNARQTVELNFDVPSDETITFILSKKDSKKLIQYLKDGMECQVFFPDFEDEPDDE